MAKVTNDDVLRLAQLARLHVTNEEVEKFAAEIDSILHYIDQLKAIDLEDTEPTYQVTGLTNVMRPDEVIDYGVSPEELLKNAPAAEKGYIKVRRVIE